MSSSSPLPAKLAEALDGWDIVKAEEVVEAALADPDAAGWVADNGVWELVPLLVDVMDEDHQAKCPQVVETCGRLLVRLASVASSPREAVVALIEHCEAFQPLVKFRLVLPALGVVLSNLLRRESSAGGKVDATFDWTLDTVVSHIHGYAWPAPVPDLTGPERLTLDSDPEYLAALEPARHFAVFADSLARELEAASRRVLAEGGGPEASLLVRLERCSALLAAACVKVLGRPLSALDLHPGVNGVMPSAVLPTLVLVRTVLRFRPDVVAIAPFGSGRGLFRSPIRSDPDEEQRMLWELGMGTLFFILSHHDLSPTSLTLPHVYNPAFTLSEVVLPLVNRMLMMTPGGQQQQRYLAHLKGLDLLNASILRLLRRPGGEGRGHPREVDPAFGAFDATLLEMGAHCDLLKTLLNLMVSSEAASVRSLAFGTYEGYLRLFDQDWEASYRLIGSIFTLANVSGVIGHAVTRLKDCVLRALSSKDANGLEWFGGQRLRALLAKVCRLANGPETDLLEVSDEVMASLNCLLCLCLRDPRGENRTKIWDAMVPELQAGFLKDLGKAIDLSRAHYKLRLTEQDQAAVGAEVTTLMVGSQPLPSMTPEQAREVVTAALNTFDLMECVHRQLEAVLEAAMKRPI